MSKPILWIATNNKSKIREIEPMFSSYQIKTWLDLTNIIDVEETGSTFEENALIKAKALGEYVDGIIIGDDSGICVDALDGFPGVYSKRWTMPVTDYKEMSQMLVNKLKAISTNNKNAQMVTCLAVYDSINKTEITFRGVVDGYIQDHVSGEDAFGYDYVFIPKGYKQTFAELGQEIKNTLSHRKLASIQVLQYLKMRK